MNGLSIFFVFKKACKSYRVLNEDKSGELNHKSS